MARIKDKEKAIKLRMSGASYTEIKAKLGISKSTLSGWLRDYPLSRGRIKELRDNNPKRIENYINTMRIKREEKQAESFERVKKDVGALSNRELFVAGFFLYWAEGGKTQSGRLCLANTDPVMIQVFIHWLQLLEVQKREIKIKLHLYKDMDQEKEIHFWQKTLCIEKSQFVRSYIKDSKLSDLTYKKGFGHGTCNVMVGNTELLRYVLMGMKYIGTVVLAGSKTHS